MVPPTKGAGILYRLYEPLSLGSANASPDLEIPDARITSITSLGSTDAYSVVGSPAHAQVYEVLHISKLLKEGAFEEDVSRSASVSKSLTWHVYKRGFRLVHPDKQRGDGVLPKGAVMVAIEVTPGVEHYEEYARWFDDEHAKLLSRVPGWIESSRYELAKSFGDHEGKSAPFLAVHFYDEVNGLGGAEWMESTTTEWTQRTRDTYVSPMFRRLWSVVEQRRMIANP